MWQRKTAKKYHFWKFPFFMTLGGWAFEKGKRGPNEPKVTLFTIDTEFLASRLNVTIYYYLLSSFQCSWAHKASTRSFHLLLSWAALSKNPQVHPCCFISVSTVLLQVSFGLPLPLRPSGVQRSATLAIAVGGRRRTCPIHLHLLLFISSVIGLVAVISYKSSLEIVFGQ